jgi:hypothetical protein
LIGNPFGYFLNPNHITPPIFNSQAPPHTIPDDVTAKPPKPSITIATPSVPLPKLEQLSPSPNFMSKNHLKAPQSSIGPMENKKVQDWDGWPDGEWSYQFTHSEYEALNKLSVHWATIVLGGDKHHDINSLTLDGGKHTKRKCLGIIHCKNPDCDVVIRPQTRDAGIQKQLKCSCDCGWNLHHVTCNVLSTLIHYKNGIMYHNGGIHLHQ